MNKWVLVKNVSSVDILCNTKYNSNLFFSNQTEFWQRFCKCSLFLAELQNKPAGLSNKTYRKKILRVFSCQHAIWKKVLTEELLSH